MKFANVYMVIFILALLSLGGCSDNSQTNLAGNVIAEKTNSSDKVLVYFFYGEGCPHCTSQKPYLNEWAEKYPELEIRSFETWSNKENAALFQEVAEAYGIQARGVPTTFIGEKNWVGFSSSRAPEIENYIKSCIENSCESPLDELE